MGYVRVNGNTCGKSLSLAVAPTTISGAVQVFPNPATDQLSVAIPDGSYGNYEVELQSLNSTVLYRYAGTARTLRISVKDYPAGLYLLRAKLDSEVSCQKILITH
jgi:hypothetical protein